ncbi:GspH/FimT family pseudopilin [Thermodesulfovibrionales bacterium]|nr:GspH/FimT family pseudopilin [Thermodesulfovibrionales bacterium]
MRYRQETCLPLKRHRQVGFSLIEVLIVLGILTIVAAIAVPQIDSMLESHKLSGATRTIWSDLQKARMTAIKENTRVRVIVCNENEEDTLSFERRVGWGWEPLFTRNLGCKDSGYPGVTVIGTNRYGYSVGSPVDLIFTSRGTMSDWGFGTITVRGFDRPEQRLIVSQNGRVRIDWDG